MKFISIFGRRRSPRLSEEAQLAAYRQSGDIRLLGTIYQPYMEVVFAICFKYLRDEEDSKDAVMQIFEKLVSELRVHPVANFRSWLHTVTRNYCLMQLRSRGTKPLYTQELPPDVHVEEMEDEAVGWTTDSRFELLDACLQKLAATQRNVVELFYLHEKCYHDISLETGLEFGKVKSYIQNGRRNLKICMEKNGR